MGRCRGRAAAAVPARSWQHHPYKRVLHGGSGAAQPGRGGTEDRGLGSATLVPDGGHPMGGDGNYFSVENDAVSAGILLFPGLKRINFCSRRR